MVFIGAAAKGRPRFLALNIGLKNQPVISRLNMIRCLALHRVIVQRCVHVGQDGALGREPLDPAKALRQRGLKGWWFTIATMPFYWLLMSIAAWMALWQLAFAPFKWNKTEHGLSKLQA